MLKLVLNQFILSDDVVRRLGDVMSTAVEQGDMGVVAFVQTAVRYSVNGCLRARDLETLSNLERIYNRDYYRGIASVERVGDKFVIA